MTMLDSHIPRKKTGHLTYTKEKPQRRSGAPHSQLISTKSTMRSSLLLPPLYPIIVLSLPRLLAPYLPILLTSLLLPWIMGILLGTTQSPEIAASIIIKD